MEILSNVKKTLKRTSLGRVIVFIIFFVWCFSFIFGFAWAIVASLNTHDALMMNPMSWPEELRFKNYIEAFKVLKTGGTSLEDMLFNSVWFTLGTTFCSMAATTMAGYALGNFKFFGRNFIFTGIIVVSMIPIYGTGSATLIMFMDLGMYDSPWLVLSAASMLSGNTLIIMTFFQSLSPAYEEAARMDGAGFWTVFLRIHLPMLLPSIGAITLLTLIGGWNNVDTPLYYLPTHPTLATGLYKYEVTSKFNMNRPVLFAGIIMCALPPVVVFGIFKNKLMTNITIGGVK